MDIAIWSVKMRTNFETLKSLASFTVDSLKQGNVIEFDIEHREALVDAMATELGVSLATDEDIKEQAIEEVEEKMGIEYITDDITESEMYNHARKEIIKTFSGENIGGLYLIESLHEIGKRLNKFLLDCDFIEDVFGSDDEIHAFIVSKIRTYNPKRSL